MEFFDAILASFAFVLAARVSIKEMRIYVEWYEVQGFKSAEISKQWKTIWKNWKSPTMTKKTAAELQSCGGWHLRRWKDNWHIIRCCNWNSCHVCASTRSHIRHSVDQNTFSQHLNQIEIVQLLQQDKWITATDIDALCRIDSCYWIGKCVNSLHFKTYSRNKHGVG